MGTQEKTDQPKAGERLMISVFLGGHLREEAAGGAQKGFLTLRRPTTAKQLIDRLGLNEERVGFLLVNGRKAFLNTPLEDGDRVALFPPELSFNSFVATAFGRRATYGPGKDGHRGGDK